MWFICLACYRDNPNVKAIFVIRLPISRMMSHYKFSMDVCKSVGLITVNTALQWALKEGMSEHLLHDFNYSW